LIREFLQEQFGGDDDLAESLVVKRNFFVGIELRLRRAVDSYTGVIIDRLWHLTAGQRAAALEKVAAADAVSVPPAPIE